MHNTDDGVSNQSLMQDLFWGGGAGGRQTKVFCEGVKVW